MSKHLADYRRDYGVCELNRDNASSCPFEQFNRWFEEISQTDAYDPTAMHLSTVDENGYPDSRVVLLKGISDGAFLFYTNYKSQKANDIEAQPMVSLNFFWPTHSRQVRIRGLATKIDASISDNYFQSRPRLSQLAAIASKQSSLIDDRFLLEEAMNQLIEKVGEEPIIRPQNWGGYGVTPEIIEFWQGRDNRLHDRLQYRKENNYWVINRLSP